MPFIIILKYSQVDYLRGRNLWGLWGYLGCAKYLPENFCCEEEDQEIVIPKTTK